MPEIHALPLKWRGAALTLELWLTGPSKSLLCRLLLDTGATHISLPLPIIEELGLRPTIHRGSMLVVGSRESQDVGLYHLPRTSRETVVRDDLLVAPIELSEASGFHGLLGMNWLRTFAHVGLMRLLTDRPILELHDPA